MKKRNLNSLRLKKERISNFNNTQIGGRIKTFGCTYTLESICKSQLCPTEPNCQISARLSNTDVVFCGF
ncbi:hypothetical protein [uncultured Kordia sp.]|uniref:hypothetical protein n=1 Tax=uncultured Kordia sp. TaxID=507699 RepID=UPI0026127DEE|nr:hypothetical protein [uncultured Kordia sp.]